MVRTIVSVFLIMALNANAELGRSLPQGADEALIVRAIYLAREGELQFLKSKTQNASAFLRLDSGKLCTLSRVDGPSYCDDWFLSPESAEVPNGCQFQFEIEDNCTYKINSENLTRGSIFQSLRTVLKAQIHAL